MAAAGTASAVAALSAPVVAVAVPGAAPLGAIAPGTIGAIAPGAIGGGLLPLGSSPAVLAGLALVPAGLTPVAVFPALASQLVPAVTVIFSEAPVVIRYILQMCKRIFI